MEQRFLKQRLLNFTSLDIGPLLLSVQRDYFPKLEHNLEWTFDDMGSLARVELSDKAARIRIHRVLNHSESPRELFSLIFKHELIHIEESIRGKPTDYRHSAMFWEKEKQIAPERDVAWTWVHRNYHRCICADLKSECVRVLKNWRTEWLRPKISIDELRRDDMRDYLPEFKNEHSNV